MSNLNPSDVKTDGILKEKGAVLEMFPISNGFKGGRLFSMADLMFAGSLICDKCGRFQEFVGLFAEAELIANHGWTKREGQHFCKLCQAEAV